MKKLIAKDVEVIPDADTKDLEDLVGSLDKDKKDYTEDSWKKYEEALKRAKDVLGKDEPTQKEVDQAYKDLKEAIDGLKKVQSPVIKPDEPSKKDDTKKENTKPNESKPSKKPQTGDVTSLVSVISSIFVSLSGVYLVMRKKEY